MGMTQTKDIDGQTYTATAEGSYRDANGGEWVSFEAGDMRSIIRHTEKELAKITIEMIRNSGDVADLVMELKTLQVQTEEDLRIVELLFGA